MAPSPRAIIESGGINILRGDDDYEEEYTENDPVVQLDAGIRRIRYYESKKALGYLYRAIDEHQFLREMHRKHGVQSDHQGDTLMSKLWDYVKRNNVLLEWEHHRSLARKIKEA